MQNQVLNITQATELYEGSGLTGCAIRRLVRSGEIPSRRVGTKYLITAAAIEAWLQGEPQAAEPATSGGGIRRVEDKI